MARTKITPMRLTDAQLAALEQIRREHGRSSLAETVRDLIHREAQRLGISTDAPTGKTRKKSRKSA